MPLSNQVYPFPARAKAVIAWNRATHQMTLNGKRDDFTRKDFEARAKTAMMKRGRAATIFEEVQAAAQEWPAFAAKADVADEWRERIRGALRFVIPAA